MVGRVLRHGKGGSIAPVWSSPLLDPTRICFTVSCATRRSESSCTPFMDKRRAGGGHV